MKKTIKGIQYDTSKATPLCCIRYKTRENLEIEEIAYRLGSGQYFLVQVIDGKTTALFPMTNNGMAQWTEFHAQKTGNLWVMSGK